MIPFDIELSTRAVKDLNLLKNEVCQKITSGLLKLSASPFPDKKRIKKMKGVRSPLYRLRVDTKGDSFRVFYAIVPPNTILVLRVVSKKYAERVLKKLVK